MDRISMGKNYFTGEDGPAPLRLDAFVVGHSWAVGSFGGVDVDGAFRQPVRKIDMDLPGGRVELSLDAKAKSGSTIAHATGVVNGLEEGKYERAILFTGINDNLGDTEGAKKKFKALIDVALAKTSGAIYVVNVPYYDQQYDRETIDRVNAYLEEYAKREKEPRVVCIDINSGYVERAYSPSSLHPAGYAKVRGLIISGIVANELEMSVAEAKQAGKRKALAGK